MCLLLICVYCMCTDICAFSSANFCETWLEENFVYKFILDLSLYKI